MNVPTVVALAFIIILGIGITLNPDLVLTPFPVATGLGAAHVPVILILTLFVAASWVLFLLVASIDQRLLLRRIERLSATLAGKEREVLRAKAASLGGSVEALQGVARRLDAHLRGLEATSGARGREGRLPPGGEGAFAGTASGPGIGPPAANDITLLFEDDPPRKEPSHAGQGAGHRRPHTPGRTPARVAVAAAPGAKGPWFR